MLRGERCARPGASSPEPLRTDLPTDVDFRARGLRARGQHLRVTNLLEPPLDRVFRRREAIDEVNEHLLARRVERGELIRVAPGSYATRAAWSGLTPIDRHAQRVWEAAARTAPGTVFSHAAACALWGIDVFGEFGDRVDVSVIRTSGGRTTGNLRRHTRDLNAVDVEPWGRHWITSRSQTVLDMAAALPFTAGVVVADRALWARRKGGVLLGLDDLWRHAEAYRGRGEVRARRVAAFATTQSDSVRESQSRVVINALGFPAPQLQRRFLLPDRREVRTDFSWEDGDHVGEFDGVGKYLDPSILRGRTPAQALIEEKDREDALRRIVRGFSRWRTPHLEQPALLWDILTRAGLPSTRPRPGR